MSLIPAFEIGLLNAWIFIIPLIVLWLVGIKFLFSKRMPKFKVPNTGTDKILSIFLALTMFGSYFYSIFLPFAIGTIWLILGSLVYLVGVVLIIFTMIDFASTPLDKPVTKGIYRYSRNPMFIGFFLVYFGISFACVSWVYFLITVFFIVIVNYNSAFEEEVTLEHYGDEYKQYMKRTAKWIGMPKR